MSFPRHARALGLRQFASRRRGPQNWIGERGDKEEVRPEKLREIVRELKAEARRQGLDLVGVTSPRASSRFKQYEEWLAKGYHGELDYMSRADRVARRRDPSIILPRVRSVIMVGMYYWPGASGFPRLHAASRHPGGGRGAAVRTRGSARYAQDRGVVSSYAWGADYHGVLGARLKRLGAHLNAVAGGVGRFYVDTGAILERDFAERAGLGFVGKNSLVIHPRGGSGFFIGELFSTVALPRDGDEDAGVAPRGKGKPGCGACSKCRVACPTGAIVEDYQVDARRCISYLTIELKGAIPMGLRRGVGNRVYGCDICQLVCPWNRVEWGKKPAPRGGYSPMFGSVPEDVATPRLTELVCMTDEEFEQRFRESAVYRIGRERMARNAAVALGNVGGRDELGVVQEVARRDGSELVREHARWAAQEIRDRLEGGGTAEEGPE